MIQYDNYEAALKEIDDLIWLYPDQQNEVEEAKEAKAKVKENLKRIAD